MIIDATDMAESRQDADICIVGAGAAGITLACELARRNRSVILLESGGMEYEDAIQNLHAGANVGRTYMDLDASRLRFFGGTTNHWEGNCQRLSGLDFEHRPWVPHSGWPITRADIDSFYRRAHPYCQIGPYDYDDATWARRRGAKPPPLGKDSLLVSVIDQLSPPTRFGEAYRDTLAQARSVTVVLHATALKVALSHDGNRVERVEAAAIGQPRFSVRARRFVLALGAIENARLMLLSNDVHPAGVGNSHDLVGRFFMEHPGVEYAYFLPTNPDLDLSYFAATPMGNYRVLGHLELSEAAQRREQVSNIRIPFIPRTRLWASEGVYSFHEVMQAVKHGKVPPMLWDHVRNMASDIDMIAESASRKVAGYKLFDDADAVSHYGFNAMIEQLPNPDSRITLSDEQDAFGQRRVNLDWRLTAADRANVRRAFELTARELGRLGLGRARLLADREDFVWGRDMSYGLHHMGTTRMAASPRHGVVDADCRVHGLANLYVAGSSVFATSGHVPPTLTIVALAIRLADHLAEENRA